MRRYRFDRVGGQAVAAHDSHGAYAVGVQHTPARLVVTSLWLEPKGQIGAHDAVIDQLFLVVTGNGWAVDGAGHRTPIVAGEAVFWHAGERHAVSTDVGLSALVLEGEGLDPDACLTLVEDG